MLGWSRERLASEVSLLRAQLGALTSGVPDRESPGGQAPGALETVSVPEGFAAPFVAAHGYVQRYFESLVHRPAEATISIAGERYILLRAASMSVSSSSSSPRSTRAWGLWRRGASPTTSSSTSLTPWARPTPWPSTRRWG